MPTVKLYVSLKPLKQWCKARGYDFNSYLNSLSYGECMNARIFRPTLIMPKIKLTLWEKIKNFFRY